MCESDRSTRSGRSGLRTTNEQPSEKHIVDHIDTNRRNNRADNLRWITRLDNILNNPVTRRRIEIAYGSIDAFFENPRAPVNSDGLKRALFFAAVNMASLM